MPLKKNSAAAKAWGRKMLRLRKAKAKPKSRKKYSISKLKKRRKSTMAKRKTKRKSSKRSASIMGINTAKALAAGLYGAIRMRTSQMIAPYTQRIPLGNVSDEVGMLVVTSMAKKFLFKGAGTMRDALTAGQTIELARIGESVASGSLGINLFGGGNNQASNAGYVFA